MSTNYDPTAKQVERMTGEMLSRWHSSSCDIGKWVSAEVVRILQRQHARELPLLEELRAQRATWRQDCDIRKRLDAVLAAHAALDAAPEPTLLEAAKALLKSANISEVNGAYDVLKAAVERAERAK